MSDLDKIYIELLNTQYPALCTDIRIKDGELSFIYSDVWLGFIFNDYAEDGNTKIYYMYWRDLKQYPFAQIELL